MKDEIFLQRLYFMLAFQTMIANGKIEENGTAKRVVDLARKMDEFVEMHFAEAFPSTSALGPELQR